MEQMNMKTDLETRDPAQDRAEDGGRNVMMNSKMATGQQALFQSYGKKDPEGMFSRK